MKVLIACEFSGIVRDAFIERGHDAFSCDLLESERQGPHIMGDVLKILNDGWDLMIAHPPCTYLANSGVHLLYKQSERWKGLISGAVFFRDLLNADIPKIAVENPIMHKYAVQIIENHRENLTPSGQNKLGPSPDRWKDRSRTYQGIAKAMADQWGFNRP